MKFAKADLLALRQTRLMRSNGLFIISVTAIFFLGACRTTAKTATIPAVNHLRFVNQFVLPNALPFGGTVVGGLSGIDYDRRRDQYYLICDDPSAVSPARFYTMKIPLSAKGIDSVLVTGVTVILDPFGNPYPDIRKDRIHSADLEAMRYDPSRDELVRASEGQRVINADTTQLQSPDIVIMDRNGHYKDSFFLPSNLRIRKEEKGPRHNSVLEGLAFDKTNSQLFVSVEDALYEDGPKAGLGDSTALIRIFRFDRNTKKQSAAYAYKLDPVPYPATPPGAFKINGVSDIMSIGNNRLLVIERAWSTGRIPSNIRVYLADLNEAQDISGIPSLLQTPPRKTVSKKLLLNMEDLGFPVYNVEGVTFGPKLPNGHASLIFVVDDNFSKTEKNQFLLFEVID
jgi:hypothetical protein